MSRYQFTVDAQTLRIACDNTVDSMLGNDCASIDAFHIDSAVLRALNTSNREALLYWLQWNDHNGCFSDDDCIAEGLQPMTTDEMREALASMWSDSIESVD